LYSQNLRKNAALATYSLKMLQELQKESAIKYDRASRGTLKLFRTTDLLNEARRVMELANVEHVAFEMLDKHSIVELEPSLVSVKNEIAGGIYYPEDESGDAYKFCQALAGLAAGRGVRFQYGTSIDRFIKRQGIITGIETSSELMEADYYVLAAGSYSPGLAGGLGLDIPIRPVKGYSITFRHSPDKGPVIPVIDESRHLAVTPFPDRIRISGAAELRGHDVTINNNRISMMVGFFRELFPGIARSVDYSTGMPWAGLRPYSCDGTPILGPCAIDNLILNTGHGHLGWTMAAGSGKLIADLRCTGKTDLDLAPYSLSRFGP
jgi:D-amino-acid dehydrogenase